MENIYILLQFQSCSHTHRSCLKQWNEVEKWRDRRDVLLLSTKFVPEIIIQKKISSEKNKPRSIIEHNKHRAYIGRFDQMKVYKFFSASWVNWSERWNELVVGSAIVIAYILHQQVTIDKMSIFKFREAIQGLLKSESIPVLDNKETGHILADSEKKGLLADVLKKFQKNQNQEL